MIDSSVDLAEAYRQGSDMDQKFIANLAQFLCAFLKENSASIEVLEEVCGKNRELRKVHESVCFFFLSCCFSFLRFCMVGIC